MSATHIGIASGASSPESRAIKSHFDVCVPRRSMKRSKSNMGMRLPSVRAHLGWTGLGWSSEGLAFGTGHVSFPSPACGRGWRAKRAGRGLSLLQRAITSLSPALRADPLPQAGEGKPRLVPDLAARLAALELAQQLALHAVLARPRRPPGGREGGLLRLPLLPRGRRVP